MNSSTKILYDCHKATFLIEKRAHTRLTLRETAALQLHLTGCSLCRLYAKQSALIGEVFSRQSRYADKQLPEGFKLRLQAQIDALLDAK